MSESRGLIMYLPDSFCFSLCCDSDFSVHIETCVAPPQDLLHEFQADEEYYVTASYMLSLANRAYDLLLSSEPAIKRQLLKLLLQNCGIDHGSLRYTLNYPFSAIFNFTNSHNWLLG